MNTGSGACGEPHWGICSGPAAGSVRGAVAARLAGSRNKWAAAAAMPGRRPSRLAPAGRPRPAGSTFLTGPANHPIRCRLGTERHGGRKTRKSCWCRAGRGLLPVPARAWTGSRRGRGMDSVTRGSGIALSVLIAVTASILLLLPGKPAGSWRSPGPPGRAAMASAVATSTWGPLEPGSQSSASSPAGGQPAAGPRPGCRATSAHRGRARPVLTGPRPGRTRPGAAQPRSCRPPRTHRHQHTSRRLSRYRGIHPDLP
jgi:hypothetical protein